MRNGSEVFLPRHMYDLRHDLDRDDFELGLRAAIGLYAENAGHTPFEIICHRGYIATGKWRLRAAGAKG